VSFDIMFSFSFDIRLKWPEFIIIVIIVIIIIILVIVISKVVLKWRSMSRHGRGTKPTWHLAAPLRRSRGAVRFRSTSGHLAAVLASPAIEQSTRNRVFFLNQPSGRRLAPILGYESNHLII
jgi:hypothetical protein